MEDVGVDIRTTICWVPLGVAAQQPKIFELPDAETTATASVAGVESNAMEDIPEELNMEDYDREEKSELISVSAADLQLIENGDPLVDGELLADEEAAAVADLEINPKLDYPIVLGCVESGEDCSIETLVYSPQDSANYAHHNIVTEAFPLSIAWLPVFKTKRRKHIIAVGSFLPVIEIYDNDVIDQIEPEAILDAKEMHHTDAVAVLQVNPVEQHLLLSASHDGSVIVWDLKTLRPVKQYPAVVKGKITAAEWNIDGRCFAVAGEGKKLSVVDARTSKAHTIKVGEEVEALTWISSSAIVVATREGAILCYQYSSDSGLSMTFEQTICECPVLSICSAQIANLIICGNEQGMAYVYDCADTKNIKQLCCKDLKVGSLYDAKLSPDLPNVIAFAGNELAIWDLKYEAVLQRALNWPAPEDNELNKE